MEGSPHPDDVVMPMQGLSAESVSEIRGSVNRTADQATLSEALLSIKQARAVNHAASMSMNAFAASVPSILGRVNAVEAIYYNLTAAAGGVPLTGVKDYGQVGIHRRPPPT